MNRTIFEISETPIAPGGSYGSDDFLIDFGDIFIYNIADSVGDLDEEDEKSRKAEQRNRLIFPKSVRK